MPFSDLYVADAAANVPPQDAAPLAKVEAVAPGISRFMAQYAGRSYNRGLYRIHPIREMPTWTARVVEAFPSYQKRIFCFGYDWLGRHFALDAARREGSQCQLLMLEPGSGQSLQIPATFMGFHDVELVEYANDCVATEFYQNWLASGGAIPGPAQCIGYRKPLFLNGEDDLPNLELTDLEVYWSICAQLLAKVRNLPDGTPIGNVGIR